MKRCSTLLIVLLPFLLLLEPAARGKEAQLEIIQNYIGMVPGLVLDAAVASEGREASFYLLMRDSIVRWAPERGEFNVIFTFEQLEHKDVRARDPLGKIVSSCEAMLCFSMSDLSGTYCFDPHAAVPEIQREEGEVLAVWGDSQTGCGLLKGTMSPGLDYFAPALNYISESSPATVDVGSPVYDAEFWPEAPPWYIITTTEDQVLVSHSPLMDPVVARIPAGSSVLLADLQGLGRPVLLTTSAAPPDQPDQVFIWELTPAGPASLWQSQPVEKGIRAMTRVKKQGGREEVYLFVPDDDTCQTMVYSLMHVSPAVSGEPAVSSAEEPVPGETWSTLEPAVKLPEEESLPRETKPSNPLRKFLVRLREMLKKRP